MVASQAQTAPIYFNGIERTYIICELESSTGMKIKHKEVIHQAYFDNMLIFQKAFWIHNVHRLGTRQLGPKQCRLPYSQRKHSMGINQDMLPWHV